MRAESVALRKAIGMRLVAGHPDGVCAGLLGLGLALMCLLATGCGSSGDIKTVEAGSPNTYTVDLSD
jgi:hypothetical protein